MLELYMQLLLQQSITLREGARLQTFPDSFLFAGNQEEIAAQIGNAVPPRLAQALGTALLQGLAAHSVQAALKPPMSTTLSSTYRRHQLQLMLREATK